MNCLASVTVKNKNGTIFLMTHSIITIILTEREVGAVVKVGNSEPPTAVACEVPSLPR